MILYKNKINPIVSFPGLGNAIIFGQKTLLSADSAFSRVNVRGLLIECANNTFFTKEVQNFEY